MKKDLIYKIVLIGDASTGKSSLLRRYCENTFDENYKCTVGVDFQIKILKINEKIVKLQIWDTAGQERFKTMTKTYYRNARACLIVYDLTRRETFDHVKVWAEQYMQDNPGKNNSVIILGNKKDLKDRRQVSLREGETLANEIGCLFKEVSAKEGGDEIEELFYNMTESLLEKDTEKTENNLKVNDVHMEEQPNPLRNSMRLSRRTMTEKKKNSCC